MPAPARLSGAAACVYAIACVACVLAATVASAQSAPGSITGSITNADGTPATGLPVAVMDLERSPDFRTNATDTDARGSYTISALPPGRYLVAAGHPEDFVYAPGVAQRDGAQVVIVIPGQSTGTVNVALPSAPRPRFTVRGRVRMVPETASATAVVVSLSASARYGVAPRGSVAADGTFTIPGVAAGTYFVSTQPNPLGLQGRRVVVDDRDVNDVEIVMPATTEVTGHISVEDDLLMPATSLSFEGAYGSRIASVRPDGRFTIALPYGEHRMTLTGYPSTYVVKTAVFGDTNLLSSSLTVDRSPSAEIRIVLGPSADRPWRRVEGRLVDRGPRTGQSTTVMLSSPALQKPASSDVDDTGRFLFPRVPPGSYRLFPTPGDVYEPTLVTVDDTDVAGVIVTRSKPVTITGSIRVEPVVPLPRLYLDFIRPAGTKRAGVEDNGRFVASLVEGAHRLVVSSLPPGFTVRSIASGSVDLMRAPLVLTDALPPEVDIRLSYAGPPPVSVSGLVSGLDATQTKLVVTLSGANALVQESRIEPDGTFRFASVLPGSYTLRLSSPSSATVPPIRPVDVQVAGSDITGVQLRVSTVAVTGVIEVADGAPVPMLSVMFNGGASALWHASNREGNGRDLRLTLPPGDYRLSVSQLTSGYTLDAVMDGDRNVLTTPLRVVEGRPVNLRLLTKAASPFVEVSGRLSMRDPMEALPGSISLYYSDTAPKCRGASCSISIEPTALGRPRRLQANVGNDGSFAFPQVAPGKYVVNIFRPGEPERTIPLDVGGTGLRGLELAVPALVNVKGRVIVSGDGPWLHPAIVLSAPGSSAIDQPHADQDGRFQMIVPEGTYKLELDYLPAGYTVTSVAVGDTTTPSSLRIVQGMAPVVVAVQAPSVARWKKVSGRVINSLDQGATSSESIELSDQEQALWLTAMIGPDGAFEFPQVFPGVYTVGLVGNGPSPRLSGLPAIAGRGPVVRVDADDVVGLRIERIADVVRESVPVQGVLRADDGGPVPSIALLQNGLGVSTSTSSDGSLQVWLDPGDQQISVGDLPAEYVLRSLRYGNVDLLRERARIGTGANARLEVVVAARTERVPRVVGGRLSGLERFGSDDRELVLSRQDSMQTLNIRWGGDGSFTFPRVFPGTYTIHARRRGAAWWMGHYVHLGQLVVGDSDVRDLNLVVPTPVRVIMLGSPGVEIAALEPYVERVGASGTPIGVYDRDTGLLFVRDGDRVAPGKLPPGFRVEQMTFGDIDLLRDPIRLSGAPLPVIRVTVGSAPLDPEVKTFSVSGRVLGSSGRNASALRVSLRFPDPGPLTVPVSADGSFRFERVPSGTYEVSVVGQETRSRVIVTKNDVTDVVLFTR